MDDVRERAAVASHIPVKVWPAAEIKDNRCGETLRPKDGPLAGPAAGTAGSLYRPAAPALNAVARPGTFSSRQSSFEIGVFHRGFRAPASQQRSLLSLEEALEQLVPPGGDGFQLRSCEALAVLKKN